MDAHGRAGTPADAAAGADGRRDPVEELSALAGDCVHCGFCLPQPVPPISCGARRWTRRAAGFT